jgi:hypothetical protein
MGRSIERALRGIQALARTEPRGGLASRPRLASSAMSGSNRTQDRASGAGELRLRSPWRRPFGKRHGGQETRNMLQTA